MIVEQMTEREIDVAIACELFGWSPAQVIQDASGAYRWLYDEAGGLRGSESLPRFSEDISAAFLVVERLRVLGWTVSPQGIPGDSDESWQCVLGKIELSPEYTIEAYAPTAPLAICRAALASTHPPQEPTG